MNARFYTDTALATGCQLTLPDHAARHIQVLRLQPGHAITVFNGRSHGVSNALTSGSGNSQSEGEGEGEFAATITRMGRSDVDIIVGAYRPTYCEAPRAVHLVVGMPANERMDWLIEKATELGVASIWPVMSERSVLRLKAERAEKKLAHWRGIAIAASEQCGRSRIPGIHPAVTLNEWLKGCGSQTVALNAGVKLLLSLQPSAQPLARAVAAGTGALIFLSGPEGGLSSSEEAAALACGFAPTTLGPRVLRAETAPLACLSLAALLPAPGALA